jgi:hypothetical protein
MAGKFSKSYDLRPSGKLKHRPSCSSQAYGTDFRLYFVVCDNTNKRLLEKGPMEELYNVNVNIFFDGHCDWNSPKKNEKQPNLLAYEYSSCNKIHFSYFFVF